MKNLEQKIRSYFMMASGMTLLMVVLGIIFIVAPAQVLSIIHWLIAAFFIGSGLYMLLRYGAFSSIVLLLMGLIVIFHPATMNILPIILGVYVVIASFAKLRGVTSLKSSSPISYGTAFLMNVISLICGLIMIIHPGFASISFITIVGVAMIVYGIADFIDMIILQQHFNDFTNNLKVSFDFIQVNKSESKSKKKTPVSEIKEAKVVKKK